MASISTAPARDTDRGENAALSLPPQSLAEAIRRVVFGHGYVNHLADVAGVPSARELYRYATEPDNDSGEHRRPPADIIVPLTNATGDLAILEYFAEACGCVVTRRPAPATTAAPLYARLAAITTDFADVQRLGADALGDGLISADEARAIAGEIADLQASAEALRLAIAHLVTAPRRPGAKATR